MRPLSAPRRDPAPSRLAYRAQRIWLTPLFRSLIRTGLPTFLIVFLAASYLSNPATKDSIHDVIENVRQSVAERPEFKVERMAIDGASEELSQDIAEVTNIDFPMSSFDLDLPGLRERVATLDAVAEVRVRIRSGGILQVDVVERKPKLVWRSREMLETIDAEGRRVGALASRIDRPDLPLVAGDGADVAAAEALRVYAAAGPLAPRIRGLLRVGERRWDVILDEDQRILLPEAAPVRALEQVIAIDQAQDIFARAIVAIDMRLPHRPTLRLTEPALEELRHLRALSVGAEAR
ncbi:cell division protein FtsQ/DivIB [Anianabacter salinae]|uniref:cell division protein FtsQ/DivIB n=1 Tax=Anianabacter salinae TaxID=2851023 RepID=UPI00225E1A7F|nr:cell division protein FtsQ/DivIB [Anianabacter salinae]MBV0912864.1 cell division protein FtsQ/DivIB [Anianabacter salinae]